MAKIKLTKGELKRQRDSLEQFRHYLPTLQLKKRQLQIKILEAKNNLKRKKDDLLSQEKKILKWIGLLGDPQLNEFSSNKSSSSFKDFFELKQWVVPIKEKVEIGTVNIAGANIPVLEDIVFNDVQYDYYVMPLWIDRAVKELREHIYLLSEITIIEQQIEILEQELRITTQRVNLFEKVKIPECLDNIRKIRIYLGDQQANAVGISKVAKKKIEINNDAVEQLSAVGS